MAVSGALLALLLFAPQQDYMAEASKALDANQPAVAEPLLRKAIEADPNDFQAHFNLAFALTQLHRDSDAASEYRKTLELKPGIYEAQLNLGILLLRDKQPSDALAPLKAACEQKPKEPRPNLYYAQALLETRDFSQAEAHFNAALAADPKSQPARSGLARAFLGESKLDDAAREFRTAGDRNGLLETGTLYEKAGQTAQAIAIYREFPENPQVQEHLHSLEIDNRLALADSYRAEKKTSQMIEQLRLAVAAEPNNFDLRMSFGRALRDDHKLIPAAQQFSAAAKLKPDDVSAWNELATALIVAENYTEGLAALDRIRALGKEIPGDYFLRAITLDKLKMREPAVTEYRKFLTTDGGAHPDQEFQARQRMRIIESELKK